MYVDDLNHFERTWQVNVQAAWGDRGEVDDVYRVRVCNRNGEMAPLRAIAAPQFVLRPQTIVR